MERTLAFIEIQLWAIIALFLLYVAGNIFCGLYSRKRQGSDPFKPQFKYMWERNELDKLLTKAASYRRKFPNNADAHYFAIKALIAKKRYIEARELASHLAKIEPRLADVIRDWFALIERAQAG